MIYFDWKLELPGFPLHCISPKALASLLQLVHHALASGHALWY